MYDNCADVVVEKNITLFERDKCSELTDKLANEVRVALVYNGISHTVMLASPQDLEEFAIGFTLSERIVSNINEIKGIDVERVENGIIIHIEITQRCFVDLKEHRRSMAGRTGCGLCGVAQLDDAVKPIKTVDSDAVFNMEFLSSVLATAKMKQSNFELTGATHAALGLNSKGEVIYIYEDIGRHIALDKLIGAFSRRNAEKPVAVLLTSRASFEMVQKAASAGIQILFAMSAVTALAAELAEKSNITLVGFCRNGRANVYSHSFRLQNRLAPVTTI
ncbi:MULTISPECIES: formate dehydrogenase accessory sulfurtransferase FdhD [Shewanella]|uniref:formate dehydrogenase accessory sulfurtransferase FdhD n=1 Tax=Shewanella TaxID=22 RepID=UPI00167A00AD|nr:MULTISPECIES: formate dehydrogenase accessory sulfurtransferase FdhD [Shewanella]MBO1271730.1 formate dehydrogenase accessory sulfurtransferase FdhD [Shewanella sp. 4t3-1-2LB]MCL2906427.1 formate dehydrogenase accessory sulfurtransferase FdhD [Shewanella fodinae]GGY93119.1 sulfurtransferase FdhD [Shewanella fodinae]